MNANYYSNLVPNLQMSSKNSFVLETSSNFNNLNDKLHIKISKEALKYLEKTDKNTCVKLLKTIASIPTSKNITKLKLSRGGQVDGLYRIKLEHFRIIFFKESNNSIFIRDIMTKNSATYCRTKCCF